MKQLIGPFSVRVTTPKIQFSDGQTSDSISTKWIFLRGAPTPKVGVLTYFFAENCMKMKEFGPQWGASLARPLDPPLILPTRRSK